MSQRSQRSSGIRAIDLFCGAGGSSWGAQSAGIEIVAAFDLWPLAGENYKENFPKAKFYPGRLEKLRVKEIAEDLGKIDLILASPECTNHSLAKGNKPRCDNSRNTAFQVNAQARLPVAAHFAPPITRTTAVEPGILSPAIGSTRPPR